MRFQIQYFSLCGGMVDVSVLGTDVNRRVGSSPTKGSSLPPSPFPQRVPQFSFGDRGDLPVTKNVVFPKIGDSFAKKEFGVTSVLFPKLCLGTSVGQGLKITRVKRLIQSRSFFTEKNLHLVPK